MISPLQTVLLVELLQAAGLIEELDVLAQGRGVVGLDELDHSLANFVTIEPSGSPDTFSATVVTEAAALVAATCFAKRTTTVDIVL